MLIAHMCFESIFGIRVALEAHANYDGRVKSENDANAPMTHDRHFLRPTECRSSRRRLLFLQKEEEEEGRRRVRMPSDASAAFMQSDDGRCKLHMADRSRGECKLLLCNCAACSSAKNVKKNHFMEKVISAEKRLASRRAKNAFIKKRKVEWTTLNVPGLTRSEIID